MIRRLAAGTMALGTFIFAISSTSVPHALANTVCGPYTDRLCEGDSLGASEYLESPNGDYKFYYDAGGDANLFYVRTSPWTLVDQLHTGAYGAPQELTYTDPWVNWTYGSTFGDAHISVWSTYGGNDYWDGIYWDTSVTPSGSHFLVLGNDGYLSTVDGTGTIKVWAGPGM